MNPKSLIIGLIIGGIVGVISVKYLFPPKKDATVNSQVASNAKWIWPDSLDAVKAAPKSYKIIYEDDEVRVLKVMVDPGATEPIHTNQWRSVAWAIRSSPFILYHYTLDPNNKLVQTDSSARQIPPYKSNNWRAESPHAIKNIGIDTLIMCRVEFKK